MSESPPLLTDDCPIRGRWPVAWSEDLPADYAAQVVAPVRFDITPEHEVAADRCLGTDALGQLSFCAFRYVETAMRSDDDVSYYAAPVYAETVTAWRLVDGRWLVRRSTIGNFDAGLARTRFVLQPDMPR